MTNIAFHNNFIPDRLTIFLLSGGGQSMFSEKHPLTRLLMKYPINIISMELPGHGNFRFYKIYDANEYINLFLKNLHDTLHKYNINDFGIIGFSLGGLLALKAINNGFTHLKFCITFGAGFGITTHEEKLIHQFTTMDFFNKQGWGEAMKKYHGDGWPYLINTLHNILTIDSSIFTDPKSINIPTYMFLCDGDQAFPPKNNFVNNKLVKLIVVNNCHHFEYFSKIWEKNKTKLEQIIMEIL